MTAPRIAKLKKTWEKSPGATERDIAAFLKKAGNPRVPADYLEMMRFSNGGNAPIGQHGLRFYLDPLKNIVPNSRLYNAPPGVLLVGELTGLNTLAGLFTLGLDSRGKKTKFSWMYGFHYEELQPMGDTLEEALGYMRPLAQRIKRESDTADELDVIYIPTPYSVATKMLEVGRITSNDMVYDLGCGDGRILVAAAKECGVRGIGFDLERERIKEARANAREAGVQHLVKIKRQSLFEVDLSGADVLVLYLLPDLLKRLLPTFRKLRPGVRIVAHQYTIEGYEPDETAEVEYATNQTRYVRLWTTPLKKTPKKPAKTRKKTRKTATRRR